MTEVVMNFYKIRYKQGKATIETLQSLVSNGKLTQSEYEEIINGT